MNYKEFCNTLGVTLPNAKMWREELLELEKKAELGYKVSLVHLALYPLCFIGALISMKVFNFLSTFFLILPIVALVVGGFKRLWRGLIEITVKANNFIPIFPINCFIALIVFAYTSVIFFAIPFPFFWKMRKNIKFELEAVEDTIKNLEATEQA